MSLFRKAQISIEQLTSELASERGNAQKMENSKVTFHLSIVINKT